MHYKGELLFFEGIFVNFLKSIKEQSSYQFLI